MGWYCIFRSGTGQIMQCMNIPSDEAPLYERPNEIPAVQVMACNAAPDMFGDYVVGGAVVQRPTLPSFDKTSILANGSDTATLSGLPDPCTVLVNGQEYIVTGGTLELDAGYPGTYRVEIRHFPYRDFVQEIIAT